MPIYSSKYKMKNSFHLEDDNSKKALNSGPGCLSIHCIVLSVSSVEDMASVTCQTCDKEDDSRNRWKCKCKNVETSGCVAVPEDTRMNDFLNVVLVKLGYPSSVSSFASGSILIRNWEPLPLKSICPGMNRSVGDILGDMAAVVSLRIQIFRPKITILERIRDDLFNFLIRSNQNFLIDSGCPLDAGELIKLSSSSDRTCRQTSKELPEEIRSKLDTWLKHLKEVSGENDGLKSQPQISCQPSSRSNNKMSNGSSNGHLSSAGPGQKSMKPVKEEPPKDVTSFHATEKPKNLTIKPRIRTSFDPELELPKLHKWYTENRHPTKQQIYEYVSELNSLESRKGRKQLEVNNVVYWFKNARAAQKRTECRSYCNTSAAAANRGNVLKIPLGKGSGISSDDQRSLSDDETSVMSALPDDYQNRNDRCLQVVGKWNSNGQGEAVLEMQIGSHKNGVTQANKSTKKEEMIENEDTCKSERLSMDEDSRIDVDPLQNSSPRENNNQKKSQEIVPLEMMKTELRNHEQAKSDNEDRRVKEDVRNDDETSSKLQIGSAFSLYKDDNVINDSNFLFPYKSGFSIPSDVFERSLMCMSQYINAKPNSLSLSSEEKRKRNRTFIDPVTEVPRLEQWFRLSTHPSQNLIARYTDELNNMPYRTKFPKLETKNVQFWFKNRRAKNKRLNYLEINGK